MYRSRHGVRRPLSQRKKAQAREVMAQITQLDGSLQRATNAYIESTQKLQRIEHSLKMNKIALHVARANLRSRRRR